MKKIICLLLALSICIVSGCTGCKGCKKQFTTDKHRYQIVVELDDDNMTLSGYEVVDFYNYTDTTIKELRFNLFGNAYRQGAKYMPVLQSQHALAYPDGINYGQMTVNGVEILGEKAHFDICGDDQNILSIPLGNEVFPDEYVTVKIYFTLKLSKSHTRTGYSDTTVNLGNFYPILCVKTIDGFKDCIYYPIGDPFYSNCADYNVQITLDKEYVVCSSGVILDSKIIGDKAVHNYTLNSARDFAFVLSKGFDMLTGSVNGVTVNYYYQLDTEPEQSLKSAIDAINTFTNLFGGYPYKTFSIAETSFYQGGMEYPAMVMISDNLKERSVINEVIIHETAHQWWYAVVGNDEIEHAFLDEGLTEYSVVLFYEKNPSYGFTRAEMVGIAHKSYQTYCSIYDRIFGGKDTSMDRSLKDFTSEYEYVNIAYVKGALMFDYLRVAVGEDEFFKGLKKYYKDYSFKNATPDDLIFVYENSCQTSGFFSSWINGEVII